MDDNYEHIKNSIIYVNSHYLLTNTFFMKRLFTIMLFAAMLLPWAVQSQAIMPSYTYSTGVDATKWITLDATATELFGASKDDFASSVIDFGFNFQFGEDYYHQFSVSTNGLFTLGPVVAGTSNGYAKFSSSTNFPKIIGVGKDLGTCTGGYIKYQIVGQAPSRTLVVEYKTGHHYTASNIADVNWQVQLHENSNKVIIVYSSTAPATYPDGYQIGLGVSQSDFLLVNPSTHTTTHHTALSSTTNSNTVWPGADRYYEFVAPVISCGKPANLRLANISNSSVDVMWNEMGTASQWIIEYDTAGFALGTGNTLLVSNESYALQNLTTNTKYDVYVRSYCGVGDTSSRNKVSFRTSCDLVADTELPFEEGFETWTTTAYNTCYIMGNNGSTTSYPSISTSSAHGGSKAVYLYSTASYASWLVLPEFETPVNNLQLSFWMKSGSLSYPLIVAVVPDVADMNTFDTVTTLYCRTTSVWEEVIIPMSVYQGNGGRIALISPNGISSTPYIDDIKVEALPACPRPIEISAKETGTETAVVKWRSTGATAFDIEYDTIGFTLGTGTSTTSTVDSLELSGLLSNTKYDVYIRSNCGSETGDWVGPFNFRTKCSTISDMDLPLVESFETWSTEFDQCFFTGNNGNTTYPSVTTTTPQNGSYCMYMYSGSTYATWLVLPEFETPINGLQLSFWMRSGSLSYPLIVAVVPDITDMTTFDTIAVVNCSSTSVWEEFIFPLGLYQGTHGRIAFISPNGINSYPYLDNVKVEALPSCPQPLELSARATGSETAIVNWVGTGASGFEVQYGEPGFTLGTGISEFGSNDSIELFGLTPNTLYNIYLRANCGNDDTSVWLGPVSIRTECTALTSNDIPYFEGFENYLASSALTSTINECWYRYNNVSTTSMYPYVSSTYAASGSKSIYMFGNSSTYSLLALPGFQEDFSSYQLSFKMYRSSTSTTSPIIVGVMSDRESISTFDTIAVVSCSRNNVWETFEIPLNVYTGTGTYIAFVAAKGSNPTDCYIDDITLSEIGTCPAPMTLTASNITTSSADITWTDNTNTSWIVEYGPAGFNLGSGTIEYASSTSITLYGLIASTGYDVYVRPDCGDELGNTVHLTFHTECSDYLELPFIENFDSYGFGSNARPQCWMYGGYSSSYPQISGSQKVSGIASAYMYVYKPSSPVAGTTYWTYLVAPQVDITSSPINTLQVSFSQKATNLGSYYPGTLVVGIASDTTDLAGTFYPLDTIKNSAAGIWEEFEVSLENYPTDSTGSYIVLASIPIGTSSDFYNYVYIDNLKIDYIPSCSRPQSIAPVSTYSDAVTMQWFDENTAHSAWDIAYGPSGFNPNTMDETMVGTMINVSGMSGDSVAVQYLTPGTVYDFYIRANCGGGDVSEWRGPVLALPGAITVPTTGFTTINSCSSILCDNGGANGEYPSNSSGYVVVYPGSADSLVAVLGGSYETEAGWDYLRIYDGVGMTGTLLAEFDGTGNITDTIKSTRGPLTVQFYSDGSNTGDGFIVSLGCVEVPSCPGVGNVNVSNIAGRSAYLTWRSLETNPQEGRSYEVKVYDATGLLTTIATTETAAMIDALNPQTSYGVTVTAICSDGNTATSDSIVFSTSCLATNNLAIGNTTTTSSYLPSYTLYDYSYTQQMYLASELNGASTFTAIEFNQTYSETMERNLDIYLAHTSQTTLTSNNPIAPSNMTLVYRGIYTFVPGANEIIFNTPFNYNGTDNLVLIVDDNTGDYVTSLSFSAESVSSRAIYKYQDVNDLVPGTSISFSNSSSRNSVVFKSCLEGVTCIGPNVVVEHLQATQIDVVWAAGNEETSWKAEYRQAGDSVWTLANANVTTTSYSFTGLTDGTVYEMRITSDCGNDSLGYTIVRATTPCVPISDYPFIENFDSWTSTNSSLGDVCWHRLSSENDAPSASTSYAISGTKSLYFYGDEDGVYSAAVLPKFNLPIDTLLISFGMRASSTSYQLQIGIVTDPEDISTFIPVTTAQVTNTNQWEMNEFSFRSYNGADGYITILIPAGSYSVAYIDNVEVYPIPSCPRPTNVVVDASTITTNSADISWVDSIGTMWMVEYGPRGFARGTGSVDIAYSTQHTLQGLDHSSFYDVYVSAVCSANDTSYSSFVASFSTLCGAIDNFPFYEDFTGYQTGSSSSIPHYPYCWSGASDYSTTYPYISSGTGIDGTTTIYEYMYAYAATADRGTKYTYLALPAIDSTMYQISDFMVSFAAKAGTVSSTYDSRLYVGVATDPTNPATFVAIDTIERSSTAWEYVPELEFSSYTGNGKYVVFWICPQSASYTSFYLDNIELDLIPTCRRPVDLHITNGTSTSIELAWTERNNATSWVIEYDTAGFELGTGNTITATSNPFTITGLTPSTEYDFYVKSICSATDESEFSFTKATGWTSQVPATIPYAYDFENITEWNNWASVSNRDTVKWYRGTATAAQGTNSMYISKDGGATNSTVSGTINATTYRDFDFGANDTNFTITFKAKAGGRTDGAYDGLMLFLVDPWLNVTSSTSAWNTPWGHVDNLTPVNGLFVRLDTVFDEYTVELDAVSGVKRLAFYYCNQTYTGTNFVGEPAAVDDINITYTTCPRPTNLVASNITSSSATLSWDGSASGYIVYYLESTDTVVYTQYTTSNTFVLTGLTGPREYYWAVQAICGSDSSIFSETHAFTTTCFDGAINSFPYTESFETTLDCWGQEYVVSNKAWTKATTIKSTINAYDGTYLALFKTSNYDGYTTTLISPTLDLTGVIGPYMRFAHIQPVWGDDQDTLGVYYRVNPDSAWVYLASYTTNISSWRIDSISLPNPSATYQIGFRASSFYGYGVGIDNVVIDGESSACPTPAPAATVVNNIATISWSEIGNYELRYRRSNDSDFGQTIAVTNATSYTITGLDPLTDYVCQVRRICDADLGNSNWAEIGFTTEDLPCGVPTNIVATNITYTSATLSWTDPNGTQTSWTVEYGYGENTHTITANASTIELTDLYAGMTYNVRVQGNCSETVSSEWSEVYTFNTATCQTVSNLVANEITSSSAVITWTAPAGQTKWELSYGMQGVDEEHGTKVTVTVNPTFTIEGLEEDMSYDVYVRAVCGENTYSAWSNKLQFTTRPVSINTAANDNVNVRIYPNPANTEATISVEGINGKVEFVVADMNGRMIVTETINCDGQLVKTIDVSNLAKGAYFVHIYNDNFNATRKLIVK